MQSVTVSIGRRCKTVNEYVNLHIYGEASYECVYGILVLKHIIQYISHKV